MPGARLVNTPQGFRVKAPRGVRGPWLQVERFELPPRWVTLLRCERSDGAHAWWTFALGRVRTAKPVKPSVRLGRGNYAQRSAVEDGASVDRLSASHRRLRGREHG